MAMSPTEWSGRFSTLRPIPRLLVGSSRVTQPTCHSLSTIRTSGASRLGPALAPAKPRRWTPERASAVIGDAFEMEELFSAGAALTVSDRFIYRSKTLNKAVYFSPVRNA